MNPPANAVALAEAVARTGLTRRQWDRLIASGRVAWLKMGGRKFIREEFVAEREPKWNEPTNGGK